ncbi:MAG: hypothetical protein H8E55_34090 [Pelagibacterales bacterium]|nr:hypothetical protein [Pelagibacterales bacterium]
MPAGTWNLGRIRKTADYIGLKDLSSISINDDSTTSDQFFNIVEFPTTLTGGKNLFKIKANTNTLVRDSTIYIEILDSNGNPIYHEPVNYLEADGTRVIAVYIYPDTPYGTATVYIAGRAKYNPITGIQLRHSQNINDLNYYNSPNVLWKRSVTTAPERLNSTEIIFTKKPILNVREVVQPYLQPVNLTNVATQSNGLGTCVIRPRPQSISTNTAILQGPAAAATTQGSFTRNSPPSAMGTQIPVSPLANAISTAGNISTTPALNANNIPFTLSSTSIVTAIDESIFETSTPFFSSDMNQGDIITVVNPNVDCTYGAKSKYGVVFPASQFNIKTSYSNVSGIQPLSGSYRFVIDIILSTTKAHVVLLDGFKKIADNNTGGKWQVE